MPVNTIRKSLAIAVIAAAASFGAQSASATTFNFGAIAGGASFDSTAALGEPGGEADWNTLVGAGVGILDVGSGISVVGTATTSAEGSALAYFDNNPGLGVCSVLNGSQCNPANDDNVGAIGGSANSGDGTFETLILTFSEAVNLTDLIFKAEGHGDFNGDVKINGVVTAIAGGSWAGSLFASVFELQYIPVICPGPEGTTGCGASNEFYLGSATVAPVPVPAAGLLLISAFGGLAAVRRRRRKAT